MSLLFYLFLFILLILYVNNNNENFNIENKYTNMIESNYYKLNEDLNKLNNNNNNNNSKIYPFNYFKINDNVNYDNDINNNINEENNNINEENNNNLKNISKLILYKNIKYYFLGIAINKYYNQYYLLYESLYIDTDLLSNKINLNRDPKDLYTKFYPDQINILNANTNYKHIKNKIYKYILIQLKHLKNLKDIKYIVAHEIDPINKLNINDYVTLSSGQFQIGPLVIIDVK